MASWWCGTFWERWASMRAVRVSGQWSGGRVTISVGVGVRVSVFGQSLILTSNLTPTLAQHLTLNPNSCPTLERFYTKGDLIDVGPSELVISHSHFIHERLEALAMEVRQG